MRKILLAAVLLAATLFSQAQTPGNMLRFYSSQASITIPSYWGVVGSKSFTVEMWMKNETTDALINYRQRLFVAHSDMDNYTQLNLHNGSINAYVKYQGVTYSYSAQIPDIRHQWKHIAYTYDATTKQVKVYVDGNITSTVATVSAHEFNYDPIMMLGGIYDDALVGCLDEVHIWNSALSNCQIKAGMNSDYTLPAPSGLMSSYNFNQGVNGSDNTAINYLKDLKQSNHLYLQGFDLNGWSDNFFFSDAPFTKTNVNPTDNTPAVTQSGGNLTATLSGATYQWVNVGTGNSDIYNANSQSFTPTADGSYAVKITKNGCTQQSPTINYVATEITQNSNKEMSVSTNPTGEITINLGDITSGVSVEVFNTSGIKLDEFTINNQTSYSYSIDQSAGVYIIKILANNQLATFKVLKK